MIERLFVVIGAGASRGCAPGNVPTNAAYLPPLVTELFAPSRPGISDVLAKYPLAKLAAADLRGRDTSLAIEETIRQRYRDSEHELDQRIFRAIPPYLQELLFEISRRYTEFPQNYESLVANLLRLDEVVFISLNYDVLLDNVLGAVASPITGMKWYVDTDRRWSLIKLHGSVNWARNTSANVSTLFTDPPVDLPLDEEIVLRSGDALWQMRGLTSAEGGFVHGELHYPVLSVPVGQADELVCPRLHVEFLQERLAATQALHILLIGYSGNDREVLALVRESGRHIKSLTIIDRGKQEALAVADRLRGEHGLGAEALTAYDGTFDDWVASRRLSRFVETLSAQDL